MVYIYLPAVCYHLNLHTKEFVLVGGVFPLSQRSFLFEAYNSAGYVLFFMRAIRGIILRFEGSFLISLTCIVSVLLSPDL